MSFDTLHLQPVRRGPSREHTSAIIRRILLLPALVALFLPQFSHAGFLTTSSDTIKRELTVVKEKLSKLPKAVPTAAPSTMGYRSKSLESMNEQVTLEVIFHDTAPVDLIVLIPAAYTDDGNNLRHFGFPKRFFIERILPDRSTDLLADHRHTDYTVSGIEPQHFPVPDIKPTAGIRITVTCASPNEKKVSPGYVVAFGELFAFAKDWNVALNANISASDRKWSLNIWNPKFLTDGFSLFSPIIRQSHLRKEYNKIHADQVVLTYDLGTVQTVDEFRIWPGMAIDYSLPSAGGIGFPTEIIVEKMDRPNDPRPQRLFKNRANSPQPGSTPFMHRLSPTPGRWFRFTLGKGFSGFMTHRGPHIALNEVELFGKGQVLNRNILPEIKITNLRKEKRPQQKNLNDGLAEDGQILPLRKWLEQFSLQRDLRRRKEALESALERALQKEKKQTENLIGFACALIIVLALMIRIVRLQAQRRWANMREQIACDLHDEVGANLSSIAHSTELVQELLPEATDMQQELLQDAISTARLTSQDTQQFIQLLEQRDKGSDMETHIHNIASQILGNTEYTITLNETRAFNQIAPIRQWDVVLFLKESLNNIIKHSGASRVNITTQREHKKIKLIIEDDGCGLPPNNLIPRHLKSRAKKLKGNLSVETSHGKGTRITLTLTKWKKR